jgi:hypothetical protein
MSNNITYPGFYLAARFYPNATASIDDIGITLDGSQPFSLGIWTRTPDLNTEKLLLEQQGVLSLKLRQANIAAQITGAPTIVTTPQKSKLRPNTWHYIGLTYDGSKISIYIDGELNCSAFVTLPGGKNAGQFIFGGNFWGDIRRAYVFKKALLSDEMVNSMYSDIPANDLYAHFDFSQKPPREIISNQPITITAGVEILNFSTGGNFSGNDFIKISGDDRKLIRPGSWRKNAYTLQAWVKLDPTNLDDSPCYNIFANGGEYWGGGVSFYVEKMDDGYHLCCIHAYETDTNTIVSNSTITSGKWINVAVTYEIDKLKLYIDATLDHEIQGVLPAVFELADQEIYIGAEISPSDHNAIDWWRGMIGRLDIWEVALNQEQITQYAKAAPDFTAEGIQAAYDMSDNSLINNISLCKASIVGTVESQEISEIAKTGDTEEKLQSNISHQENELLSKAVLTEIYANHRPDPNKDSLPFNVTSYTQNEMVYFIICDQQSAYSVGRLPQNSFTDEEIWWIKLFLLIISCLISLFISVELSGRQDVINFIAERILGNVQIEVVLAASFSSVALYMIIRALYFGDLLAPLLKIILKEVLWWTAITLFAKIVALITGITWLTYAVEIAIFVTRILIHISEKPPSVQLTGIKLKEIYFNYNNSTPGTTSLKLYEKYGLEVASPEWTDTQPHQSYALYAITQLKNNPINLKATIIASAGNSGTHIKICATDASGFFGDSEEANVTIGAGKNLTVPFELVFRNHSMHQYGIQKNQLSLIWLLSTDNGTTWTTLQSTEHNIYIVYGTPKDPWGAVNYCPRVDSLNFMIPFLSGLDNPSDIMSKITEVVYTNLNLRYDTTNGASFFTGHSYDTNIGRYVNTFSMSNFIATSRNTNKVNCTDCATIVATFANLFGCNMYEGIMQSDFKCNPILAIGGTQWVPPFTTGFFSYHEVAVDEQGTNNQQRLIYDACLKINNSTTPANPSPLIPTLPTAMPFSQCADSASFPRPILNNSYREHLATNDSVGAGRCIFHHITTNSYISFYDKKKPE